MGNCRVLIVEDEYFIGEELAEALRALHIHTLGPIDDIEEAVSISLASFDAAVLDINLHGSVAYSFADTLTDAGKPFVFTTGYSREFIPDRFHDVTR
ncbi:response regulator [Bradyrhizobium sp. 17]|jgi:DNA-binding response OmpR family regulator|uniref:response regulator n=1 Tax=Bradyrhizobium sp. 17 TaxID=2782649 RepID=UPI001FF87A49|nr:response regulator [Bradyrhizobium sp. 17]MCK1519269.1 response regulator [Bradyrhizobium sp. 17]